MEEFHDVLGDAFLTRDERKIMELIKDKIREIPHNMVEIPMNNYYDFSYTLIFLLLFLLPCEFVLDVPA